MVRGTQTIAIQTWPAVTLTAPALGVAYGITQITYNTGSGTFTLDVTYNDYTCISSISNTYVHEELGGAGYTLTRVPGPALPLKFRLANVPANTSVIVVLEAVVDFACVCSASPGTLTGSLNIVTASPPAVICSDVPTVTGLTYSAGSTCATVSWLPSPGNTDGYVAELYVPNVPDAIQAIELLDWQTDTAVFPGLDPATTYTASVRGRCGADDVGPEATIEVETLAARSPFLGAFTTLTGCGVTMQTTANSCAATITYVNFGCLVPILAWAASTAAAPPAYGVINQTTPTTWVVSGLAPGTKFNMSFTATALMGTNCTSSACVNLNLLPATPVAFNFTTPGEVCDVKNLSATCTSTTSATLSFSWKWGGVTPPTFTYTLAKESAGAGTATPVTVPGTSTYVTTKGLIPDTAYVFNIRADCSLGASSSYITVRASTKRTTTPELLPFIQTSTNPTFGPLGNPPDMVLLYSTTNISGDVNPDSVALVLTVPNPDVTISIGRIIVPGDISFGVTGLVPSMTYTFQMTGTANDGSGVTSASFPIVVPTVPITADEKLFDLIITNYGGPPSQFSQQVGVTLPAAPTPAVSAAVTAMTPIVAAAACGPSSYASIYSMCDNYAETIVERFIKYRMQTLHNILGYNLYLPLSRIYFGNARDPATQGTLVPTTSTSTPSSYTSVFTYNAAISPGDAVLGAWAGTPVAPLYLIPPFLVFYKRMMIYNWEMVNQVYANNAPVELGANMYGSTQTYWWWFNATVNPVTGSIETTTPFDPLSVNSVIDNIPYDGNNTKAFTCSGWNSMERWFMHIAYCNQVMRWMIYDGQIVSTRVVRAMTLVDLTPERASYFQISSITTDSEEGGFPNTLYPDTAVSGQYYDGALFPNVTPADCNATIALLWNKWLNQTPAPKVLPSGSPVNWKNPDLRQYGAPQPRVYMPATPFLLPPAMSMSTPGLIKNMKTYNLGDPNFSSVDYILNEIYDTSDSQPTYFPSPGGPTIIDVGTPHGSISVTGGAPFTSDVKTAALSKFLDTPERYNGSYGTWDNIPGNLDGALTGTNVTYIDEYDKLQSGPLPNPNGGVYTGAITTYSSAGGNQYCALMNTSMYTPWNSATTKPWVLVNGGAVKADNTSGDYKDYFALAWALEGSRYDLYNGLWAYNAAHASGRSDPQIDYYAVKQGLNTANGATLWLDLSTGLKPRVASIIIGATAPNTVTAAQAALKGMVYMLSCEAGPFVNAMGVRAKVRDGTGATALVEKTDLLTFMCPSSDWPCWSGMQGQWWGPGTKANANKNVRYVLDQQLFGPCDPGQGSTAPTSTGGSEDNFGVFADFNIIFAAWTQMALDAQGIPPTLTKAGAVSQKGITATASNGIYSPDPTKTGVPKMGLYELAFLPMSWCSPPSAPV